MREFPAFLSSAWLRRRRTARDSCRLASTSTMFVELCPGVDNGFCLTPLQHVCKSGMNSGERTLKTGSPASNY